MYIIYRYIHNILSPFWGPSTSMKTGGVRSFTHRLQAERGGMAARPETIEVGTGGKP